MVWSGLNNVPLQLQEWSSCSPTLALSDPAECLFPQLSGQVSVRTTPAVTAPDYHTGEVPVSERDAPEGEEKV